MPETQAGTVYLGVKLDDQQFKRQMAALANEAQRIMQKAVSGGTFTLDTSAIEKSINNVARSVDTLGDNLMSTFSKSMEQGATEGMKQTARVVNSARFPKIKIEFSEARLKEQIDLMGQRWQALDAQRVAQAQKVARLQEMARYSTGSPEAAKANEELARARLRLTDIKMAAAQADAQVFALEQQLERMGQKGQEAPQKTNVALNQMQFSAQKTGFSVSSAMSGMVANARSAFSRFATGAKGFINKLKEMVSQLNIFKRSSGSAFGRMNPLMKFGLMAMGIRSIYMLIRRMTNVTRQGFEEMGKQFDGFQGKLTRLKDSLGTLKASFSGMLAPAFEALLPMIETVVNRLVAAFNTIGIFMARIFGQSTYKMVTGYNSAVSAGAGAASASDEAHKKLYRTLASFDELEILKGRDAVTPVGGGGGGGATAGSPIYKEIAIEPFGGTFDLAEVINKWIDGLDIAALGKQLSDKFIAATDWLIKTIGKIKWFKLGEKVGQGWNAIDWENVVKNTFQLIVDTMEAALDFLYGLITTIDWAGFADAIYDGLKKVNWEGFWQKFFRLLGAALGGALRFLWQILSRLVDDYLAWWKDNAFEGKKADPMGMINAIGRGLQGLHSSVYRNIVNPIISEMLRAFGVEDPDNWALNAGKATMNWFISGIKDGMILFARMLDTMFLPMLQLFVDQVVAVMNFGRKITGQPLLPKYDLSSFSAEKTFSALWDNVMPNTIAGWEKFMGDVFNQYHYPDVGKGGIPNLAPGANLPYSSYTPPKTNAAPPPTSGSGGKATGAMMAAGGYVTQPTLAMVGEQSKKEVVLPLERNTEWARLLANELRGAGGTGGDIHITQPIYLGTDQLIGVIETVVDREGRLRNKPVFA